jgi:pimeloyl-ACP methyl ester carboxylesterase
LEAVVGSEVLTPDRFPIHWHRAKEKKHPETVVFIHHMWGNHRTTARHFRFLTEQGYDCVSFDLLFGSKPAASYHPEMRFFYRGVFYIWTRQIRSILNAIEGDKIVFAFSGPSLSAFWACDQRTDIKKFICDGGPFHDIYENTRNFFREELGIRQKHLNAMATFFGASIWGYQPLVKLHKVLNQWPKTTPILSIRGVKDNIVALKSIRAVFEPHPDLDVSSLELPEAKHLNGMRDFPEEYKSSLLEFL